MKQETKQQVKELKKDFRKQFILEDEPEILKWHVQSKIELLEELLDKTFNVYEQELWFIGNIRTRLNQQKEILKYLETL